MRLKNLIDNLFLTNVRLYAFFFLLIVALKWPFFSIPPVWDDAFSLFPAADFLVKNDFNYFLLSAQPRYLDGGPTQHGFSLLTLVTALVLKTSGGGPLAWSTLHTLQWLMAAAIGTILTRVYSNQFKEITAFLLAFATLVYPLMLAQIGGMYIEVPLLFLSVFAFYLYRNDQIWMASLALVAACVTKESGAIAVGALAVAAFFGHSKPVRKRIENVLIVTIPSLIIVLFLLIIVDMRLSFSVSHTFRNILNILIERNFSVYKIYISFIPEFIVILLGSVLLSVFWISNYVYRYLKNKREESDIIIYNSSFVLLFSTFHFIVHAYIQMTDSHFLTRYFFYAIPSMFFMIYYTIDKLIKKSIVKVILLLIIIGVCLINRCGVLYPKIPFPSIAIAERSEEYIDGYQVQKEYIGMIEKRIPKDVPIYLNLPDYFLTHYSVSQYVNKPLQNSYYIGHVLKVAGNKFEYPDHFVLVYSYPWLGGAFIKAMMQDISRNKEFSVEVLGQFQKGYFSAYIFEIKRLYNTD